MPLDYNEIKQKTKAFVKEEKKEEELTQKELVKIQSYIEDMELYIASFAEEGKDKFVYDCSKISARLFHNLCIAFKQQNPLFFVLCDYGIQKLTIEWHGKNEI